MKHQISVHSDIPHINTPALTAHIKRCIRGALEQEGVTVPCEINVLLTDNRGIREINRDLRDVDRETDVLSFPMFEFTPGEFPEDVSDLLDPGSSLLPLGDMALSVEKIKSQAEEFGHSQEREIGYLTVHSVLHLLGYDHLDEGPMKRQMRAREDAIMEYLNIPR
ncbi:MAG: rRNA maturation RNase YbeY [Oscillospiraceae bacterium]|nr:rRNA maturation RNase YbeY [Oscillospiraceae bacterium]